MEQEPLQQVQIERLGYLPWVTLGEMLIDGEHFAYTVERPWQGNAPFLSCIPPGVYRCRRYSSRRYPDTFEVCGVPERTYILFHVANDADDVEGCIGPGDRLSENGRGVDDSAAAMARFMTRMEGVEEFDLFVTQYQPNYP